jgi:hypothetical protein
MKSTRIHGGKTIRRARFTIEPLPRPRKPPSRLAAVFSSDVSRFDHPRDCEPEVMPRFRELAGRTAGLPQSYPFTGRRTFLHSVFGRLASRNAYALLAFHVRLHVPHVRHSIEVNAGS